MMNIIRHTIFALLLLITGNSFAQIKLQTPNVEAVLYVDENKNQPLIVGLGGSEGGNAWKSNYWKKTRDEFIAKGYAFLAIGYFRCNGAPDTLNKIALEDIHNAIRIATKNKGVNKNKIAIIGGSRGADLALLLASYYKDIKCVVSIVGSSVAFPGNTTHFSTSSWVYKGKELPFVPVNNEAVPYLVRRDLRNAFTAMLKDTIAVQNAIIKVEKIRAPILFMSATKDEICPSTPMVEMMITRLKDKKFKYTYEHKAFDGMHGEPLKHFDLVFKFLESNFAKE